MNFDTEIRFSELEEIQSVGLVVVYCVKCCVCVIAPGALLIYFGSKLVRLSEGETRQDFH